jgi:hypothetical protein
MQDELLPPAQVPYSERQYWASAYVWSRIHLRDSESRWARERHVSVVEKQQPDHASLPVVLSVDAQRGQARS